LDASHEIMLLHDMRIDHMA